MDGLHFTGLHLVEGISKIDFPFFFGFVFLSSLSCWTYGISVILGSVRLVP